MSAIKRIVIIFNRDVELSELTSDLIKLSESKFFGLTGEYWKFYSEPFDKNVSVPLGFINLNGNKYDLLAEYYPGKDANTVRMVAFENDWANFYGDFVDDSYTDPNSKNVKKLIAHLKRNLSYYSITLLTYDFNTDCPHTEELLDLYSNGTLDNAEGRCYLILDKLN